MLSPTALSRPATDLHLNICVREVVLWRQLPIVVDEVVENRWTEHRLKEKIRHLQSNRNFSLLQGDIWLYTVHDLLMFWQQIKNTIVTVSAIIHSHLCIQEDDSLLCDEEINSCALVTSSFLDFLSLSSEYITPVETNTYAYSRERTQQFYRFFFRWACLTLTTQVINVLKPKTWDFLLFLDISWKKIVCSCNFLYRNSIWSYGFVVGGQCAVSHT